MWNQTFEQELRQLAQTGNFQQTTKLLQTKALTPQETSRWWYFTGNLFFDHGHSELAEQAWRRSQIFPLAAESDGLLSRVDTQHRRRWWPAVLMTLGVIFLFYTLLFTNFPRPFDLFQFMQTMQSEQQNRSAWDDFWDTGRPSWREEMPFVEAEDLSPILQETIANLLGEEGEQSNAHHQLQDWLQDYEQEVYGGGIGGLNYYIVVAKGLFNSRAYEEAVSVLQEGLTSVDSAREKSLIYQELGTTYYYQGYELQPDGLAKYNLDLVRKSVEAYEEAAPFTRNPYLFGNLGWGYYLLGEYEDATKYSEQALGIAPSLNYVRMNLGITYLRMGKLHESLQAYESIAEYNPDPIEYEGGIRDLQELLREHPGEYPFGNFLLGYLLSEEGKYRWAKEKLMLYQASSPPVYWQQRTQQLLADMGE